MFPVGFAEKLVLHKGASLQTDVSSLPAGNIYTLRVATTTLPAERHLGAVAGVVRVRSSRAEVKRGLRTPTPVPPPRPLAAHRWDLVKCVADKGRAGRVQWNLDPLAKSLLFHFLRALFTLCNLNKFSVQKNTTLTNDTQLETENEGLKLPKQLRLGLKT